MTGAVERAEVVAWRAYLHHRPGCPQCTNTPVLCDAGRRLWDAYKAAST